MLSILTLFSRWVGKLKNNTGVHRAPLSGLRSAPRALRCAQMRFSILPPHRGKDVQLLSTEVRATQQNPRYSGKNNVTMRMIATFMTKYFASQYCVFFSNQMCIQHPIAYFFLNSNKSLIFMCFQVITITSNLKMDSTVSSFLNEGSLDSTTKSHRTAEY